MASWSAARIGNDSQDSLLTVPPPLRAPGSELLVVLGPELVAELPGPLGHTVAPCDPVLSEVLAGLLRVFLQETKRLFVHFRLVREELLLPRAPHGGDVVPHVS